MIHPLNDIGAGYGHNGNGCGDHENGHGDGCDMSDGMTGVYI